MATPPGLDSGEIAAWRRSKWLVFFELAIIALIFVADAKHFIPFSKTPFILAFGWISLRLRGVSWRDIGFKVYRGWRVTMGLGIAAGIVLEAFELFVSQPFLVKVLHHEPDFSDFRPLVGNLKMTLLFIVLAWTLAAFGEEMVYRGYLMNRVADLFDRNRHKWVLSLLLVHVGFGLAHAYQGITGIVDEGLMGLFYGLIYLRTGRSLAVPIVAHGVQDTIDFVLIFLGKYQGL